MARASALCGWSRMLMASYSASAPSSSSSGSAAAGAALFAASHAKRTLTTLGAPQGPAVDLEIGESHAMHRTFTQADVNQFLSLIGDNNPLHHDAEAATAAGFRGPILPGILMASLFPAIIGSTFPGAVYATQSVSFRNPALIDQPVVAQVTVSKRSRSWVMFHTCCTSSNGEILVEGEAMAKIRKEDGKLFVSAS